MSEAVQVKIILLTGFNTNYEPSFILEFQENVSINSGDRVYIELNTAKVELVRKEPNG